MKALLNQRDLLAVYNKGDIERVAKELNLYQSIETDKEWEDNNGMPMRKKTYLVKHSKGVARWSVTMQRGWVIKLACEFNVN